MATLLIHPYAPGHRHGILLNPSPAASPAYQSTSLPALIPSNSSLSSSASSSAPGDSPDYFAKSISPTPDLPTDASPSARRNSTHHSPTLKPRNGSDHGTVRRIRFAPLPEPRRDADEEETLSPVFLEDDDTHPSTHPEPQLTMLSALAAASISLAIPADTDSCKRLNTVFPVGPSSPRSTRKSLPTDSPLLDHTCPLSSAEPSDPVPAEAQQASVPIDCGQESGDVAAPPPATAVNPLSQLVPLLPTSRKPKGIFKVFSRFGGRSQSSQSSQSSLARTFSAAESQSINGDAQRGRSSGLVGTSGSRNSSVSRDGSLPRRDSDVGTPLQRWTSEGGPGAGLSTSKKKRHLLFGGSSNCGTGSPLERTQSLTSLLGKDDKKVFGAKPPPAANGNGGGRGRKQTRLLNGRVYGAKRQPPANPFANARPPEPEFVEWGYGGMGSVKTSAGQNPMWARLQARDDASGLRATDEDDGSGMGWVKRRREQREREARERAEREQAEANGKVTADSGEGEGEDVCGEESETTKVEKESEDKKVDVQTEVEQLKDDNNNAQTTAEDAPASPNATLASSPTPIPSTPLASESIKLQHLEHITQAITIPAPSPHPHLRHHHSHSITYSHVMHPGHQPSHAHRHSLTMPFEHLHVDQFAMSPAVAFDLAADPPSTQTPPSSRLRAESSADAQERESISSSASATSTSTEDADDGDCEDSPKDSEGGFGQDEDSDEEDEEEEVERSRRTALGAGVEVIARHHKEDHSTVVTPAAEVLA